MLQYRLEIENLFVEVDTKKKGVVIGQGGNTILITTSFQVKAIRRAFDDLKSIGVLIPDKEESGAK